MVEPEATTRVVADVLSTEMKLAFEPVTTTLRANPESAGATTYFGPVAPSIGFTPLNHWYERFTPESQLPGTACSSEPTTALPEMAGIGV